MVNVRFFRMMADRVSGFLGGRLRLAQHERGHRAGTDAALLVAATPRDADGLLLDVGAGAGAVGLGAALLAPASHIGLIELDFQSCELARENIALNRLDARARVFETNLFDADSRRAAGLVPEAAAIVLTNPPFFQRGSVRVTPDPRKAAAHVETAPLPDWTRACLALLAPGGVFAMIHRAEALAECLAALNQRIGEIEILPVLPREGEPATRILLRGVKGSRAPLKLCAPLVLHAEGGGFTPRAEAIHRGETHAFSRIPTRF
jgi:tRNA1(Val) A37 N6-methylase TrmN6